MMAQSSTAPFPTNVFPKVAVFGTNATNLQPGSVPGNSTKPSTPNEKRNIIVAGAVIVLLALFVLHVHIKVGG